ncbi:unnamed protein product, partial [Laminaria digitata]
MTFLQEAGQQRLREEAAEEHPTEATTAVGTPMSVVGSAGSSSPTPFESDCVDDEAASRLSVAGESSLAGESDSVQGDLASLAATDEGYVKEGLRKILPSRRQATKGRADQQQQQQGAARKTPTTSRPLSVSGARGRTGRSASHSGASS